MSKNDEQVMDALTTIQQYCNSFNRDCKICPLSNYNKECLVYEYPYLWQIKHSESIKLLQDM